MKWKDLDYWNCGEWQVVQEKLDDLVEKGITICPNRRDMFKALRMVPFEKVKVCIIGQDPYPNPIHATGIAFSVPASVIKLPPTLVNIYEEYTRNLGHPQPKNGDLLPWVLQGILLWNCIPSCTAGQPGSHRWNEWEYLTEEIVRRLNARGNVVFVTLGAFAYSLTARILSSNFIHTSHPSPLSVGKGNIPFRGSSLFTKINERLNEPIDWRLP